GIDIHLFKVTKPSSVRVRGKVTGLPPDSGAVVSFGLSPADGSSFGGVGTNASPPDYSFDFQIPKGQYNISGHVYSGRPEAFINGSLTVTGDLDGVVLVMRPPVDIAGRISLAEGGQVDIKDVRMTLAPGAGHLATGHFQLRTDAAGRFNSFP